MTLKGNDYRTNVRTRLLKLFGSFAIGMTLLSIVIVASANYKSDGKRRRGLSRTLEEIKQLDEPHKASALGLAVLFTLTGYFVIYGTQKDKKIIIELSFIDDRGELFVKSQTISSNEIIEDKIRYTDLRTFDDDCFDLLRGKTFKAINFRNGDGKDSHYILKHHPTWLSADINLIENKIKIVMTHLGTPLQ